MKSQESQWDSSRTWFSLGVFRGVEKWGHCIARDLSTFIDGLGTLPTHLGARCLFGVEQLVESRSQTIIETRK